jgi:hypothetical protein
MVVFKGNQIYKKVVRGRTRHEAYMHHSTCHPPVASQASEHVEARGCAEACPSFGGKIGTQLAVAPAQQHCLAWLYDEARSGDWNDLAPSWESA